MKKSTRFLCLFLGFSMLTQVQGCYGNFALTRKLYAWNGTVGDKWINSIVMFALSIVPVYLACGIADYLLFNTLQFWTGKNPVTMNEGEKDMQMVHWKGNDYRLTATRNRIDVQPIVDGKAGAPVSLVYDAGAHAWTAVASGTERTVIEMVGEEGRIADLIYPDGSKQRVELETAGN
jgi:hypothetical protein